jgi:DNA-binding MarR family transcriptional regulator
MTSFDSTSEEILQRAIDRFWETFPPVWDRIRKNVRAIAAEHFDITFEQFHILRHIRKGCCSVSELAEIKHISRPAISQAVDMLVDKGLIDRQQETDDRRYVRLGLTQRGNDILTAVFKENRSWMMEKLAPLSSEELTGIILSLDTLKRVFDEVA